MNKDCVKSQLVRSGNVRAALTVASFKLENAVVQNEAKSLRVKLGQLSRSDTTIPVTFCRSKNLVVPVRRRIAPWSS